jgi:hypothetical protein
MDATRASAIRLRLYDIWNQYGKIGLLIDDAQDANSRTARELYGSESLPEWWLQARSSECGALALQVFIQIVGPPNSHGGRGIVLIDRFLPVRQERDRPMAWDVSKPVNEEEQRICEEMKRLVRELISMDAESGRRRFFWYELITSYPHIPLDGYYTEDTDPLPWLTRSMEVLFKLRHRLPTTLLNYGPETSSKAARLDAIPRTRRFEKEDEASWKARTWRASIEGLAKALIDEDEPVILFTGAGASLAQGTYGAGMPPTWWLLEETCRTLVRDPRERGLDFPTGRLEMNPGEVFPPREEHGCLHEEIEASSESSQPFPIDKPIAPIDWLMDYLLASNLNHAHDLQCRLETIFSHERNRDSHRNAEIFYEHFRAHLERFDHGFPYHHWLLAQMPWTRIITTNFDGFHERAAFAAASELGPVERLACLALGSSFPEVAFKIKDEKQFSRLSQSYRLFKPYGNLISPEVLALGDEQLTNFGQRLRMSFRGVQRTQRGWLIVVGHAMKDKHIDDALGGLDGKRGEFQKNFNLLWVTPDAYRRCKPTNREDGTHRSTWEGWINEKMEERESGGFVNSSDRPSGPLSGTALEFSYDLWAEYQRLLRNRIHGE